MLVVRQEFDANSADTDKFMTKLIAVIRPKVSVVLPAFNEAEVIRETHRRVTAVCVALKFSYELIIVNDGSSDGTWDILRALSEADPALVAVNLSRNHGHQMALSAGLSFATGERVMIMDADLQDPPELLPEMMARMDQGIDVVYAQRRTRPGDAPLKRLFCAVYYRLLKRVADVHMPLDTGDFRLISRRVCDIVVAMPERQRYIRGMVSWVGFRQEPIHYDRDARFAGETKYPFSKLVRLAVDGIISSTLKPLGFAILVGGLALALSVLMATYALGSWLLVGRTPQGWTSLFLTVVFLGGVQLLVLGILGEYLGRIYEQSQARPPFVVDQVIRQSSL